MDPRKYSKIKYPIHKLKDDQDVFNYPDLLPFKEIFMQPSIAGLDPVVEMKYMILMYSPGSPSFDEHKIYGKRITWVLNEIGIEPDASGKYPDVINYMTLSQLPVHNRKCSIFRSLQYPMDFQIMLHAESEMSKWLAFQDTEDYKTLTIEDSLKLRKLIEDTRVQYEEAKERFLKGHSRVTDEWEADLFIAQKVNEIRNESLINALPKLFPPKDAKANMIFPEVKEN